MIININSLALVLARFCFERSAKMASISTELSSAADSSGLQNESSALIVASTLAGNKYVFGSTGYSVVTQSPKEYGWSQLCFASQHQREYFRCKPCEIHLGRSWSPDKTKQNSILGKHSSNERRKKIGNVKVDGALLTKALLQYLEGWIFLTCSSGKDARSSLNAALSSLSIASDIFWRVVRFSLTGWEESKLGKITLHVQKNKKKSGTF